MIMNDQTDDHQNSPTFTNSLKYKACKVPVHCAHKSIFIYFLGVHTIKTLQLIFKLFIYKLYLAPPVEVVGASVFTLEYFIIKILFFIRVIKTRRNVYKSSIWTEKCSLHNIIYACTHSPDST